MDHFGIEKAMLGIGGRADVERTNAHRALKEHPDRFFGSYEVDPNRGHGGRARPRARARGARHQGGDRVPRGLIPQVPINDKKFYPLYAKCVELDIPICVYAGVPGPRVPMLCQKTSSCIDEVCWFFPELKFVMRHGCEPWADARGEAHAEVAEPLLLDHARSRRSTTRRTIIDFANTRGADKVMYAGYFPMGLSLERIFTEMPDVPFRDHVWPKFLRENAVRVFKLD